MNVSFISLYLIFNIFFTEEIRKDITICHGRCTGSAYCTACSTCEYCKHCNSGGSCGVCGIKSNHNVNNNFTPSHNRYSRNSYSNNSNNLIKEYEFIVKEEKAFFYENPNSITKRKGYLVLGDKGKVVKIDNYFIYTEFKNSRGLISSGWLKKEDITIIPLLK